ncbi:TRAP transporter small permease [Thalassobaculum sp.]|uniref:TRAP transporter small permease n=1 Tax=Thalassobaculum sp. TaxID=2022740 RepID=UPI0032EEDF12
MTDGDGEHPVYPGRPPHPLARAGGLAVDTLKLVAAVLLFAMMLVTFVDVVGRYFFGRSLNGAYELTEVLLGLIVFAGLPIVTRRGEHVTVDLLTTRLPALPRRALARLAAAATALVLAVLAWRLGSTARDLLGYGDATVFLGIPLGPVAGAMAALAAAGAVAALVRMVRR